MRDNAAARAMYRRAKWAAAIAVAAVAGTSSPAAAAPVPDRAAVVLSDRLGGAGSDPQTVTLTNSGESALPVQEVTVEGGGFVLAFDGCSGAVLSEPEDPSPPRGTVTSCTVRISYAASTLGTVTGTLRFRTPDGVATVHLTGHGTGPRAVVVPAAGHTFSAPVDTTSGPQRVTLTNTGNETLDGIAVTLIGTNYAIANDACTGRTLATTGADASCVVDVTFTPGAVATYAATLRFSSNDPLRPTVDVALSGTGTGNPAVSGPPSAAAPTPKPGDRDGDDVLDVTDDCRSTAGDLANGCPSELKAEVRGRWRVNNRFSQLVSLTVRAPAGSRIELRCSGRRGVCGFSTRVIVSTTRRTTGLTRYFKGRRILPANTTITVRVTRPLQIGTYERVQTRTKRRLPKVTHRCIGAGNGKVQPCSQAASAGR